MGEHQQDFYESFDGGNGSYGKAAPTTPRGVGDMLKEARLRLGLDLPDVAATLRIRLVFLTAIEDGRFRDLPGTAYASGFLRSYAEFVGLDAEEVIRRYKAEVSGQAGKSELYFPTPVPESRAPGGAILLVALVLAGLAYGGWYYLSATDRSAIDLVPALPERFSSLLDHLPWSSTTAPTTAADEDRSMPDAAMEPEPAKPMAEPTKPAVPASAPPAPTGATTSPAPTPTTVAHATTPTATTTVTPPPVAPVSAPAVAPSAAVPPVPTPSAATATPGPVPAPPPAAGHTTAPATPPVASPTPPRVVVDSSEDEVAPQEPTPLDPANGTPAATPAPVAPAEVAAPVPPTPQGRLYGSQNKNSHITLLAKQDSWVQVRDGSEQLFTRVLRPGDMYRVPDRQGLRLRTGNAGGIVIVKDGVEGAPVGSVGQVLRDYSLDTGTSAE